MIAPTPFFSDRGCHVRIYEEATALLKKGHEVKICTYHLGKDMPKIPTIRTINIAWYKKVSAGASFHKIYIDVLLFFLVMHTARRYKPDVIYAHLHEGAFLGKVVSKIFGIPLFFDYQGSLVGEMLDHNFIKKGSLLYKIFNKLENYVNKSADVIFTSSSVAYEKLQKRLKHKTRIVLLIDGVDVRQFKPYKLDIKYPKISIPNKCIKVVYLGLLNKYQGIDKLLDIIRIIYNYRDDIHFIIMGYPNVEFYKKRCVHLEIDSITHFIGRIPYLEAAKYLSYGDIAISPKLSKTEANGKLLDYMACGLPTITFDSPVNREVLGDYGIYAKWNDATSFANCIATLADNKELRMDLSKKLRDRVIQNFTWENQIEIIEEWLNKLA